ncbi:MAG: hypothetical protein ACK2UT_00875, partial [Candidatus Promineifilaceae bacterium]
GRGKSMGACRSISFQPSAVSRQLSASWFIRRVFFDNILELCRSAAVVGNLFLLRLIAAIMFQASYWPQSSSSQR